MFNYLYYKFESNLWWAKILNSQICLKSKYNSGYSFEQSLVVRWRNTIIKYIKKIPGFLGVKLSIYEENVVNLFKSWAGWIDPYDEMI